MTPLSSACVFLPVALHLLLVPGPGSAAAARRCGSIYKGFAQCLLALGDSLSVSSQKDDDTQEIDSICRSWDDFHKCANLAMAGCPEEAAAVWDSLRQESKKMQFSALIDSGAAGNFTDQKVVNGEPHWNTGSTPLTIKAVDNQPLEEGLLPTILASKLKGQMLSREVGKGKIVRTGKKYIPTCIVALLCWEIMEENQQTQSDESPPPDCPQD
ncbi:hypothetical protein AOLI_G00098080 [Acnodon oligacanthus]